MPCVRYILGTARGRLSLHVTVLILLASLAVLLSTGCDHLSTETSIGNSSGIDAPSETEQANEPTTQEVSDAKLANSGSATQQMIPEIHARYIPADPSADTVVDGTVDVRQEIDDEGNALTVYFLKRTAPATFIMHYAAAGSHEKSLTTDELILWREPTIEQADAGGAFGDLLWKNLVGVELSVRGGLQVDDEVLLRYALPADKGRLACQIGVSENVYGIWGEPSYGIEGYDWDELERIADAMAATQDPEYGSVIAEAYNITQLAEKSRTLTLADGSTHDVRLAGIMTPAGESGDDSRLYVGLTSTGVDDSESFSFGLGGAGDGLPTAAANNDKGNLAIRQSSKESPANYGTSPATVANGGRKARAHGKSYRVTSETGIECSKKGSNKWRTVYQNKGVSLETAWGFYDGGFPIYCLHVTDDSLVFIEYQNDGSSESYYDIVKTNLDGTGREVIRKRLVPGRYGTRQWTNRAFIWLDHGYIYYIDGNVIWEQPLDGKTRRQVAVVEQYEIWAVDEGVVYFSVDGGQKVIARDIDAGVSRKLADSEIPAYMKQ